MTASYPSLIAEAKRSVAALAAELSALSVAGLAAASAAEGGSLGPAKAGLGVPELRNALRLANRAALAAGILSHRPLSLLSASLRAFLHASASSPGRDDPLSLDRAAAHMKECAEAMDAAPEYAELVLPGGGALRPPLSRRIELLPFCAEILKGVRPARTPYDGRSLPADGSGRYRILVPPRVASGAASRGSWLSLCYFDPAASDFRESLRSLESLLESGTVVRYGALEMSPGGLERAEAILPCYLVAETLEEPGSALPGKLPGLRILRVISSPDKAFIPDSASSGPGAGAFVLGSGEEEEDALVVAARAEPPPPAKRPTPRPESGFDDSGLQALPDMGDSPFTPLDEVPESSIAPSRTPVPSTEDHRVLAESRAIDESLPAGIVLPEIQEEETGSIRLEDLGDLDFHEAKAAEPVHEAPKARARRSENGGGGSSGEAAPEVAETGKAAADGDDRIRVSLAVKLIGIISLVIIVALATMVALATKLFRDEIENSIQESYLQVAASTSQKFDADFRDISDSAVRAMQAYRLRAAQAGGFSAEAEAAFSREFFGSEPEILAVSAFPGSGTAPAQLLNEAALAALAVEPATAREAMARGNERAKATTLGDSVCLNVSSDFKEPSILVTYPFKTGSETGSLAIAFLSRDRFQEVVTPGRDSAATMSLVSKAGEFLAHPDAARVVSPEPLAGRPYFEPLARSEITGGSFEYAEANGDRELAYYAKVPSLGAWVLITVAEKDAFEAVWRVIVLNACIALMIIAIAFLIVYFFSKTITVPLRELVDASKRIEEGHFQVRLRPRARDEVGLLMRSFVHMGTGLAERERLKDTFGKFVNKEVAERAAKGTLKLGGERKAVTIFFSDIRGFTSISEKMEPEAVVEFLNKYMTRMVACVNATGGNVDKYIGDSIMAVWGAPLAELGEAQYAERAIDAALMMRKELIDFNRDRGGPGKPIIRIGCGINSGPVIVGQIGSTERLEYTVIGDAVNLASRIEALNKAFSTDILVSQYTRSLVKNVFRFEPMKPIIVKGKNEPQQIYAVLGRIDDPYAPATLADARSLVGMEHKDISGVDVDEEEVKYKILPDGPAAAGSPPR